MNEWPFYHPKLYFPLTIIHHSGTPTESEVITTARETSTKGNVVKEQYYSNINFYSRAVNNISGLFEKLKSPFRILIEGAPGIGKTILSKEISFQWAENKILSNKKLLLLLFMRDPRVKDITSVYLLLKHFNLKDSLAHTIAEWLDNTNGEYLTIVLDGFDEVSDKNFFISIDLIDRMKLQKCDLIITSRTAASADLHNIVEYRAEVVGFTEKDRKDFIQNTLQNQVDRINELGKFLQSNPIIDALCYVPLNMSILLCLAEKGIQNLPKSETKLYQNFINMTVFHFLRQSASCASLTISTAENLPHPYNHAFKELSHFAFCALQRDQLVFTKEEIEQTLPNTNLANWYKLGLLKSAQYTVTKDDLYLSYKSYHFLHFSIQEYLAAYHIASLTDDNVLDLLRETFWDIRYYNTWKMYVGITKGKQFSFQHFLSGNLLQISSQLFGTSSISRKILKNKIRCLHLLQCLEEINDDSLLPLNKVFQDNIIDLSHCSLSSYDVRALAVLLLRSPNKKWKKLNLSHCDIDDSKCFVFCEILSLQNVPMCINSVDISHNTFHWEALERLCTVFKNWNTKELILTIHVLYDVKTANVMNTFAEKLRLSTSSSPLSLEQILLFSYLPEQKIMIAVSSSSSTIESFQFSKCNLDDVLIAKLKDLVEEKKFGKRFGQPYLIFSYGIDKQRADILKSCKFENVIFRGQYLLSNGIFNVINELHNSTTAVIDYNWYTSWIKLAGDYLAAVLCHCIKSKSSFIGSMSEHNLKHLLNKINELKPLYNPKRFLTDSSTSTFSLYNIDIRAATDDIAVILKDTNLQELHLSANNLQTKGVIMVAITLTNFKSLKVLNISNNNIGSEAASHIECVLFQSTNLITLQLGRNNLQTEGVIKITKALRETNSLQIFSIAHNKVDVKAADDIAAMLSHNNNLKELYLGGNNLQLAGAIKILKALEKNSSLIIFDFEDNNVTDVAADDIATVLMHNCSLTTLILNGNNLKKAGAIKIAKTLEPKPPSMILQRNIELQELHLDRNNIQAEGAIAIARALKFISTITVLSLANNSISKKAAGDIADVLSHNSKLQKLNLGNNCLHTEGAIKIAKALKGATSLTRLSMCGNHIGDKAADDFAHIISRNTKLELDIGQNKLQIPGAVKVLKAAINNLNLAVFSMSCSGISITGKPVGCIKTAVCHKIGLHIFKSDDLPTGNHKIVEALQYVSSLLQFSIFNNSMTIHDIEAVLSHNPKIGKLHIIGNNLQATGIASIACALHNTLKMTVIDISNNNISNEAADDIVTILSHNTILQQLFLGTNMLQATGVIKIAKALQKLSVLKIFDISNNVVSDEAADEIVDVLLCNSELQLLDVSNNDLKVTGIAKILRNLQSVSVLTEFSMLQDNVTIVAGTKTVKLSVDKLQLSGVINSLCNVSSFVTFKISNYNISCKMANAISSLLLNNLNLRTLVLNNTMLQTTEFVKIAEGLKNTSLLKVFDISCNNIDDQAADCIANILSHNTNLQDLCLDGNKLGIEGTLPVVIAEKLKSMETLTHLSLCNNNITHEASDDIAAVILKNTVLHTLILSYNNLQSIGAIKIAGSLQNTSCLRILNMSNNGISSEAASYIAAMLSCNSKLEELYLGENKLQNTGAVKIAEALQNTSSLKAFCISNNDIGCQVDDITTFLLNNANLQTLLINDNGLQTIGAVKIAIGLQNTSCLRIVNMSSNNIGFEAANDIAGFLLHNHNLEELYLGENNLQIMGIRKITEALQNISTLKVFCVSNNNISCEVDEIAYALLNNIHLQKLLLNNNNLQTIGAIKIAVGLQNTSSLKVLNMSNNNIDCGAAGEIAAFLSHNTNLEELYLGENKLQTVGTIEIMKALWHTKSLKTFSVSNNDINFEAADDIANVLAQNTKLKKVYLDGNNFQAAGVIKIAKALQDISTLVVFSISNNNITSEAANDIADILSNNGGIQTIDNN